MRVVCTPLVGPLDNFHALNVRTIRARKQNLPSSPRCTRPIDKGGRSARSSNVTLANRGAAWIA